MTVNYQTDIGGDMLINFWITDPSNRIMHSLPRSSLGEYSFDAESDGTHTYCFLNVSMALKYR